jgi:hypothetical protein
MSPPEIDLYTEFFGLTDALTKAEILFAVCGGVAVAIHGYPRFTRDIDLLTQRSDEQRVREIAARLGFILDGGRMPVGDNPASAWEIARVSKVIGNDILALDLLLVGPDIQSVWESRLVAEFNGRMISVVSREGLRTLKRISGRKQDLIDLEQLGLEP